MGVDVGVGMGMGMGLWARGRYLGVDHTEAGTEAGRPWTLEGSELQLIFRQESRRSPSNIYLLDYLDYIPR